jgi:hypothetical protein
VVAIVAVVALALLPFMGPALSLSGAAKLAIGLGLAAIALVGVLVGFLGGGFVAGAVAEDVEKAIPELLAAHSQGDQEAVRQAAIRVLDGAHVSTGPTTVGTFDVRKVAERLGDALPVVERIERVLLERQQIYPVFTMLKGEGADPES